MSNQQNFCEDELVLAPPVNLFNEARSISQTSEPDEKFPFLLHYNANQRDFLLAMLEEVGAVVGNDDCENHKLSVRMNMTQLDFVKHLDGIEKSETAEGVNPFLFDEASEPLYAQRELTENEFTPENIPNVTAASFGEIQNQMPEERLSSAPESDAISGDIENNIEANPPMAMSSGSECPCPTNASMETAATVADESTTHGYICCPGAEQWFKFTATRTGRYTIYTTGSLDTIGTLYDSCGNQLIEVDDFAPCGKINFRFAQNLTAGTTYYIRVRVSGNATGTYVLKVTEAVLVNSVSVTPDTITLERDVLYELPIPPIMYTKGITVHGRFRVSPYSFLPPLLPRKKYSGGDSPAVA